MYHWKFVLMIQRKKVKRPFMFGTIVHQILEAEAKGKKWKKVLKGIELDNKKLFRREIEMYGNIIEDIRYIMEDYFDHWNNHPTDRLKPLEFNGELAEHEFRIEIEPGIWFTGKIDLIGKARKMKWVVEHKTFNRLPSEDDRWRSVQAGVYIRAMEIMGFEGIDGVLWDYVNSKPLMVPGQLTATGKVSQARMDTLPSRVEAWLEEEKRKRKDFSKILKDAEDNRKNRFIRLFSPLKRPVVKMIWADFVDTAKEIQEFHGKKKDQNIGRHCSWCDYQALCKAEATGSDIQWIIERDFQQEDQSHKKDREED